MKPDRIMLTDYSRICGSEKSIKFLVEHLRKSYGIRMGCGEWEDGEWSAWLLADNVIVGGDPAIFLPDPMPEDITIE